MNMTANKKLLIALKRLLEVSQKQLTGFRYQYEFLIALHEATTQLINEVEGQMHSTDP